MTRWTRDRINNLHHLWAQGVSTAEIGKAIGVTKNAVIGKADREGLTARPSPIKRTKAHAAVPKIAKPLPPLLALIEAAHVPAAKPAMPAPAPKMEPEVMTYLERNPMQCEWLEGDPEAHSRTWVRCDAPAVPGKSWCACHNARVFVQKKKRASAEALA